MKAILLTSLVLFLGTAASADVAKLVCGNESKTITLNLGDVPDVRVDSTTLKVDGSARTVNNIHAQKTSRGVSVITVFVGKGPGRYNYYFQNLGSLKCINPNTTQSKAQAVVKVINSLGVLHTSECECG